MSVALPVRIEGIGTWTRGAADWKALRAVLRGEQVLREGAPDKPAASALPPAERRRAPESVLLAAEVAAQACAAARRDAATLPCVFTSTHGELAITDYMCATLATAPHELSPTKFHNSVHNAPAGYWTIATGSTAGSSAVSGFRNSFGAALLEATTLALAEDTPVLFAAYAVAACGPLLETARTTRAFGAAFVLSPSHGDNNEGTMVLRLRAGQPATASLASSDIETLGADSPLTAHALALLTALAADSPQRLTLPAASGLLLDMEICP